MAPYPIQSTARRNKSMGYLAAVLGVLALGAVGISSGRWVRSLDPNVVAVDRGAVAVGVHAVGRLEPLRKVEVFGPGDGVVESILVEPGSMVRAGDLLIRLDGRDVKRDLRRLEARQGLSEALYHRSVALVRGLEVAAKKGGVSGVEVAKARAEVERYRAQFAVDVSETMAARERFSETEIRSPIDGVVLALSCTKGDRADGPALGKPLAVIGQMEKLVAKAYVSEFDVARLRVEQGVRVNVDALPGRVFNGTVQYVGTLGTAQDSSKLQEARFPISVLIDAGQPGGQELKPGMTVRLVVDLGIREDVLQLPLDAVARDGNRGKVLKVDSFGRVVPLEVEVGLQNDRAIELLGGIEEGAKVQRGVADLRMN